MDSSFVTRGGRGVRREGWTECLLGRSESHRAGRRAAPLGMGVVHSRVVDPPGVTTGARGAATGGGISNLPRWRVLSPDPAAKPRGRRSRQLHHHRQRRDRRAVGHFLHDDRRIGKDGAGFHPPCRVELTGGERVVAHANERLGMRRCRRAGDRRGGILEIRPRRRRDGEHSQRVIRDCWASARLETLQRVLSAGGEHEQQDNHRTFGHATLPTGDRTGVTAFSPCARPLR
jgi:hypothetical protein